MAPSNVALAAGGVVHVAGAGPAEGGDPIDGFCSVGSGRDRLGFECLGRPTVRDLGDSENVVVDVDVEYQIEPVKDGIVARIVDGVQRATPIATGARNPKIPIKQGAADDLDQGGWCAVGVTVPCDVEVTRPAIPGLEGVGSKVRAFAELHGAVVVVCPDKTQRLVAGEVDRLRSPGHSRRNWRRAVLENAQQQIGAVEFEVHPEIRVPRASRVIGLERGAGVVIGENLVISPRRGIPAQRLGVGTPLAHPYAVAPAGAVEMDVFLFGGTSR